MASSVPTLDDAFRHWQAAKGLAGEQPAFELFEKIVEVDELIRRMDPKRNPDRILSLLEWIFSNIEQKKEYKTLLVNLSIDLATEALKAEEISTFLSRLDIAAKHDSDMDEISRKLRRLGDALIRRIISETRQSAIGMAIKQVRADMYGLILMRTLVAFASCDLPVGFGPEHVRLVLDKVLIAVTEGLRK